MNKVLTIALCLLLAACQPSDDTAQGNAGMALGELLGEVDSDGFARAIEPRRFSFPADHGPHPDFRSEWWYVTGQLSDAAQRRYGFQLTFFRFALQPETPSTAGSRWQTREAWMAHFAISDASQQRFLQHERFARGALGLAGAEAAGQRIWLDNWQLSRDDAAQWSLHAEQDGVALSLQLGSQKPPVLQGDRGLSQKGAEPGNASYYYSLPRLSAHGELRLDGQLQAVSGEAWLDREWSTSSLDADVLGWDWLSLQLIDGRELMLYRLRHQDGSASAQSYAALIDRDGGLQVLNFSRINWKTRRWWRSPEGRRYPVSSTLTLPELGQIELTPLLDAQEMDGAVRYWEGAMLAHDARGELIGRGYLELTGYASARGSD